MGLLSKNPSERFGEDISKIKSMVFFNDFDWDSLSQKSITVPYRIKSKVEEKKINKNFVAFMKREES